MSESKGRWSYRNNNRLYITLMSRDAGWEQVTQLYCCIYRRPHNYKAHYSIYSYDLNALTSNYWYYICQIIVLYDVSVVGKLFKAS
jgi:hypothetical protein